MSIRHNVGDLQPRMRERAESVGGSVRAFLADIAARVERGMTDRLSGGGAPGAYPVPRRTGNLARSAGHTVGQRQAVVWNSAEYARAVHEGFHAYGNPNAPYYGPRQFMTDAIAQVDPVARLQAWMERTA